MKRLLMVFALILAMATMMVPVSASAALFNEINGGRAAWEAAVSYIYSDVTTNGTGNLPAGNIAKWVDYILPGGETINFDPGLTHTGDFYYTTGTSINIALNPFGGVSAFGFEVMPPASGTFDIVAYLQGGGFYNLGNSWVSAGGSYFYGWTNLPVYSISIISYGVSDFGIGHLVEGGVGTSHAPVPEPSKLLLIGSGLVVFASYCRRWLKK